MQLRNKMITPTTPVTNPEAEPDISTEAIENMIAQIDTCIKTIESGDVTDDN